LTSERGASGLRLALLFVLALAARLAFVVLLDQPLLFQHQYTYFTNALHIAENAHPLRYVLGSDDWRIWDGHWTIAPLYYLFAAAVFRLFGPHLLPLQLLQCLLDAAVAVGVARLGERVAGPRGYWAGVAYALYWPAVEMPSWTMTENVHTPLLVAAVLVLGGEAAARGERRALMTGGLLIGISALARSVSSAFLGLAALVRLGRDGLRAGWRPALLLLASGAVAVAPWLLRNVMIGQPPMIETAAYENIWYANHLVDSEHFRRQREAVFGEATPEAQRSAALHFALRGIREHPDLFLGKVRDNFWHFLRPDWLDSLLRVERPGPAWQYALGIVSEDLLFLATIPPLLVFLLVGRSSPTRDLIALWTVYYLLMIIVVFHNELRYRSALMPFAFPAAAGGVAVLADRDLRRRTATRLGLALGLLVMGAAAWPMARAAVRASVTAMALRPALARFDAGDLEAAKDGVLAAATHDPKSSRPWLAYARRLVFAGHLDEAIDAYRHGSSLGRPGGAWTPLLVLPRLLHDAGRTEEAEAALRDADTYSWNLEPWGALEIAWTELPPPRTNEVRLGVGQGDYGAVRGFLYPAGEAPFLKRYQIWNKYPPDALPPGPHRWSRHRAWLRLVPLEPAPEYELTLLMGSPLPSPLAEVTVAVRADGGAPVRFDVGRELRPCSLKVSPRPGEPIVVQIDTPTWCRAGEPAEQGIRVDRLRVRPLP
jgi:hypothetical protein